MSRQKEWYREGEGKSGNRERDRPALLHLGGDRGALQQELGGDRVTGRDEGGRGKGLEAC